MDIYSLLKNDIEPRKVLRPQQLINLDNYQKDNHGHRLEKPIQEPLPKIEYEDLELEEYAKEARKTPEHQARVV